MFADDVKLFTPNRSMLPLIEFQRDIFALADWCRSSRLSLNTNKCKVMSLMRAVCISARKYVYNLLELQIGLLFSNFLLVRPFSIIFWFALSSGSPQTCTIKHGRPIRTQELILPSFETRICMCGMDSTLRCRLDEN